jgi:branched-subunit amino acid permease
MCLIFYRIFRVLWICTISWKSLNPDGSFRHDIGITPNITHISCGRIWLIQYPEICDILFSLFMLTNTDFIQSIGKVFRPLDFFHSLLHYSLILKWI